MPESPSPEVSSTPFGQYQLIEKIAQGGMAEIFKGKALDLNGIERTVVIKRILPHIAASPEFVEMLIDEAKIAVRLSHGNIAQIYDLGKVAEDYFIVMEYVEGRTLSQVMKRLKTLGRLMPVAHAVYLASEIANGLDYMHRKADEEGNPLRIVHRDISPQNIILSTAGTVKIIDFGIAKAKTKISTTDSGVLKGKFAYMSPEHAEGEKLDWRSDIFSLGIVLFELLTGQRLFKGKNNPETIRKVKKTKVPRPSGIRSVIPEILDEIVLKALQRDRERRYQSSHEIAQDLTRLLIQNDPKFSPREVARYLQELFPEISPGDFTAGRREETPLVIRSKESPQESEDGPDETAGAPSDVIRAKLKEAEVFDIPPKPPEESLPSVVEIEERTSKISIRRLFRRLVPATLVVLAIGSGLFLYRSMRSPAEPPAKAEPPPEVSRESPIEKEADSPVLYGSLMIDSEPRGARIFLNDADTNRTTPATLEGIEAGRLVKLGLHLDRYRFWEGNLQAQAGKTETLSIPLELNLGGLEINSLPSGAEVILNGQVVGKTPFVREKIPPESAFDLSLRLEGYEPWERSVKIFGGKKEIVNASLKKLPRE